MGVDAHRRQHRGGLQRLGRTRAARVSGDAEPIEAEEHGLRLDARNPEAQEMGYRVSEIAVGDEPVVDAGEKAIGQSTLFRPFRGYVDRGDGGAEPGDGGDVLVTRPPRPLLV